MLCIRKNSLRVLLIQIAAALLLNVVMTLSAVPQSTRAAPSHPDLAHPPSRSTDLDHTITIQIPLPAPGNLVATPISQTTIDLTWTDNSGGATDFRIERFDGSTWFEIGSVPAGTTPLHYSDSTLNCGTTRYYRVRGYLSGQFSDYTGVANATTLACPTNTPTLTATPTVTPTPTPVIAPDGYEENDAPLAARSIPRTTTLNNLTISPASDPDYFIFTGVPGAMWINAVSSFGMLLDMTLYAPDGTTVGTALGTNPAITGTLTLPGYYLIELNAAAGGSQIGYYQLSVYNEPPFATPTPGPPGTPAPTATALPTPTLTPTPNLGGPPDVAEPNNTFPMAFRLAPGNTVSLNFNSGVYGTPDIDYFVITVKAGVTYTCTTSNLGLGTDTILAVYGPVGDASNLIGVHDDLDSQSGNVASQVTWQSAYDGQVYVVVSQNGPVSSPGQATYTLQCRTGSGGNAGGGSGAAGAGGGATGSSSATGKEALKIQIVAAPTRNAPSTSMPPGVLRISVVVAYDENANGLIDLSEGVMGLSIRVIDPQRNTQITSGFTDARGSLMLIVSAEQGHQVLVVIPLLSSGKTFSVGQSDDAHWEVLLPASRLPGLIP